MELPNVYTFFEDGKDIRNINTKLEIINAEMIIKSTGVVDISKRVYIVGKAMV